MVRLCHPCRHLGLGGFIFVVIPLSYTFVIDSTGSSNSHSSRNFAGDTRPSLSSEEQYFNLDVSSHGATIFRRSLIEDSEPFREIRKFAKEHLQIVEDVASDSSVKISSARI